MTDVPPTPLATLRCARRIAREHGLAHVYTGNVHDVDGGTTACSACGAPLIVRDWYEILEYRLRPDGTCTACGAKLAGGFGAAPGTFRRRRMRVVVA